MEAPKASKAGALSSILAFREEFFTASARRHATIAGLQAALDAWVTEYNTTRPHPFECGSAL